MDINNIIGENIKYFRNEKKISQQELASQVSITQQYLSAIEKGTRSPATDIILSIAKALDVSYVSIISSQEIFHTVHIDITLLYIKHMEQQDYEVKQVMKRALESNNSQIIAEIVLDDKTWEAYQALKDMKTPEEFWRFLDENGFNFILRMPSEYVWLRNKYEEFDHDVDKVKMEYVKYIYEQFNGLVVKKGLRLPLHINIPSLCIEDLIWYWYLTGMIDQKERDRLFTVIEEKKKQCNSTT